MELLGMGANMQSNGYFLGCYSSRDIIFGAEGNTWTLYNGNSELKNDYFQIGSIPLSSTCHPFGYNKELLKQTILKHEAIFRDQIHELHRIYQKQRELMDEIKRNELYKHHLRLETSSSSSSLFYSPNMPKLTGQSSELIAENIQLPLVSVQEKSRQLCSASAPPPIAITKSLKDPKLLESTYRKVGKKILDLQLPADEYMDSEAEPLENERVIKVPQLPAYTSNGISQVVCNTDEKPYGANSNGFADLNVPFRLEEKTGVKSNDLRVPIHQGNYASHKLPYNVIQNLNKKPDFEACSDDLLPNQGKKHGQLSSANSAGQNVGILDSLTQFNDMESQSVSVKSLSKKLEQVNNFPCVHSLRQITPGPWTEISGGTHDHNCSGWLTTSSASRARYQLVSEGDMTNSQISPAVFVKSGHNLDSQNYLLSSNFCSKSNLLHLPSISPNDLNDRDSNGSSSANHEFRKGVKDYEDMGTQNNINLNIIPDATAFDSIQIAGEDKFQDSRLPWLKERPASKGNPYDENKTSTQIDSFLLNHYKYGAIHSDLKLNMVKKSDMSRDNTLGFDLNGKPHAAQVCQNPSKNLQIGEIEKISDVNSQSDYVLEMGDQIPAGEHLMENEKKKHEHLAGVIDLNSCMDEDENMPSDLDLQAPASPENKECSPPRGESDENQLEMPFQLVGLEDPGAQEEQVKIAARALVSISGLMAHNGVQLTTCPPSESFMSSPLHWFAGIVSTIVNHSENKIKVDFSSTITDVEKFLPADFDYFEFMSLNLTETRDLDYCYKSSGQNEQEAGSTSPTQPRKCRMNRGRWGKDFQSEILPSLTSLSRFEVTEDLQTIGALVEAAGTHSATDYLRSAGRNVLARGKRKSYASASNITDLLLDLKQLNSNTEISIEKRGLILGKITRKRRGQRFPISHRFKLWNQPLTDLRLEDCRQ